MTSELKDEFIAQCIHRIDENVSRVRICLEELSEDEVWSRPNSSSNSIGNLILHLCGNIRQYVISSLGGQEDTRERDKEFSADKTHTKEELLVKFLSTISETQLILKNVSEKELMRNRIVQGFQYSGTGIVIHIHIQHSHRHWYQQPDLSRYLLMELSHLPHVL